MNQATRPLFQFDPGWLFIAAGLVVCAAGVLLPAQSDLDALRTQLDHLKGEETRAYARLKAHSDFMDQVDRADPALVRRLAAAQLNMIPQGDTPVLLVAAANSPVTDWIDATVTTDIRPEKTKATSMLSRLANGPHRLWLFGGGIMSVFMGLLLSPGPVRLWRRSAAAQTYAEHEDAIAVDLNCSTESLVQGTFALEPECAETTLSAATNQTSIEEDEATNFPSEIDAATDGSGEIADEIESAIADHSDVDSFKSAVLLEPRIDPGLELSALDLLDEDLQDELNEIDQADDRCRDVEQPLLESFPETVHLDNAPESPSQHKTSMDQCDSSAPSSTPESRD